MPFNPSHVFSGPGTLYAAPLGTTEPSAVTGAWPAGWTEIGYTDKGSTFSDTPTFQPIEVEEEIYPLRNVLVSKKSTLDFVLAEFNEQNLTLAVNGGIGTGLVSGVQGSANADGSVPITPPAPGYEGRVMLGWDSLPKGATSGPALLTFGRHIFRQCIQTGDVKIVNQKGSTKHTIACTFELEVPATGLEPWGYVLPSGLLVA